MEEHCNEKGVQDDFRGIDFNIAIDVRFKLICKFRNRENSIYTKK